ncbi:hypothetical protein [Petrotoga sp. 9PW.55.5.1]|jgi:hypothetical protein|uniref:hypothetical protein n=1 Tax=Petrotoga sp. 9PW.55.5.1 TaxID=1308979 RepID=UPI001314A515|nr:hypothetical protein [Petrotoga sp. 9PW.55.5.1]
MSIKTEKTSSQDDPVKILIKKYPRIIILRAVFNLLEKEVELDLENLEKEAVRLLKE